MNDPICCNPGCFENEIRWSQHEIKFCRNCGFEHIFCPNVSNKEIALMSTQEWLEYIGNTSKKEKQG